MIPHIPVSTFKTICRTCLMTKENCSMFEVNCGSMSICQMLEQYTGIHIEETEDVMPTNICQNCIELLCISFEFFETCKSSEEVLKKSLEKELREKAESQLVEEDIVVTERIILQFESDDDSDGEIYTDQDTEFYNCENTIDENEDCQMDSQDDCKSENQDDYKLENQDEYKLENQDDCKLENQDAYKLENQDEYKLENQDKIEDDNKMEQTEDYNMENFVVSTIKEEDVKEDIHLECLHCKTSFNNYKVYDTHLRKRNKQCTICRLDFQCDVLLVRHFRSNVHREMTAKKKNNGLCIPCDQLFDDHADFVKHFHDQHNGEQKCIHCMQPIRDVSEHLETHNRLRKVGVGRKICEICGKDVSNGYYNLHMKAHNEEDRFVCKICGNKFKYANNLRRHEKIHNGHYTLCPHCGKEFTAAHSLKSHIEHIHGITEDDAERNALICETCGCLCTNKLDLRKHIARSHGARADRTPTCFVCRRRFQTRDDLAKHKEIHQRYECKICLKQYLSEKMYRNHLERHGQEGLEHMPIEDANLPYECEHCGKRFKLKMNLTYHEFLHSGLKPFKCKLCPKSFRQPAHLRTHMIQHTGERRFKCEICNRAFVQPSLLRIHMRVHTGEKPYSCPVCEKAFHDLNVMRKHQKRHIMQMDS